MDQYSSVKDCLYRFHVCRDVAMQRLKARLSACKLSYPKRIELEIGFSNEKLCKGLWPRTYFGTLPQYPLSKTPLDDTA